MSHEKENETNQSPEPEDPHNRPPPNFRDLPPGIAVLLLGPEMEATFPFGDGPQAQEDRPETPLSNFLDHLLSDAVTGFQNALDSRLGPPPPFTRDGRDERRLKSRLAQVLLNAIDGRSQSSGQPLPDNTPELFLSGFLFVTEMFDKHWQCLLSHLKLNRITIHALMSLTMSRAAVCARLVKLPRSEFLKLADKAYAISDTPTSPI